MSRTQRIVLGLLFLVTGLALLAWGVSPDAAAGVFLVVTGSNHLYTARLLEAKENGKKSR